MQFTTLTYYVSAHWHTLKQKYKKKHLNFSEISEYEARNYECGPKITILDNKADINFYIYFGSWIYKLNLYFKML